MTDGSYAARTVGYAFGLAGDMELANMIRPKSIQEQKIAETSPPLKLSEPSAEEIRYEAP